MLLGVENRVKRLASNVSEYDYMKSSRIIKTYKNNFFTYLTLEYIVNRIEYYVSYK